MQTTKISNRVKKIKNWHLSFLVLIASLLSIALINNYVFAQTWAPPDNPPVSEPGNIVLTPMVESLDLNDYNISGDNIIIDPNADNVLKILNDKYLCFGDTNCINDWPSGTGLDLWDTDGTNVYRQTGNVGIQDSTPASALTVGANDAFQVSNTGEISVGADNFKVSVTGDIVRIKDLDYIWPSAHGIAGTFLRNDGIGGLSWAPAAAAGGDNLGDHVADQNIQLGNYYLSYDATNKGIRVLSNGNVVTTNYVGIGTGTPNKQLHIKTASGNAEMDIQSAASPYWGFYQDDTSDDLRFWNVDNRVTFTDTGEVGIGTISPSAKLEVVGDLEIGSLENNNGDNFFGADCAADNYVYGIDSNGALNCRPDLTGTGTIDEPTVEGYIFDADPANVLGTWTYLSRPAFYGGDSTNPPFSVDSNVQVTNLNADWLDGMDSLDFQNAIGADCVSATDYVYGVADDGTLRCRPDLTGAAAGDNLGDHVADMNIVLGNWYLSGDGGSEGIRVLANGNVTATNYVGIGTGTPNKQLHIKTASGNAEMDIQSASSPYWGIYQDDATDDLRFWNVDNRVTFTDSGEVGIGTITPSAKLEVVGDLEITSLEDNAGANFFGDCLTGNYIQAIDSSGNLTCAADQLGAGTVDELTVENYIFDNDIETSVAGIWTVTGNWTVNGNWTYNTRPAFNGGLTGSSAPFSVDSTYVVANLNADRLDGLSSEDFQKDIGANCPLGNYVNGVDNNGTLTCSPDLTGGTSLWTLSGSNIYRNTGNVGIGDTSPSSLLTVGASDAFQVNSAGDIVKIKGFDYIWPAALGAANTYLKNNGAGTLTWATVSGDNLGNHTATENIKLSGKYLSGDGNDEGILVGNDGQAVIMSNNATGEGLLIGDPSGGGGGAITIGKNDSEVAIKVGATEALWHGAATNRFSWGFGGSSNYFADRVGIGVQPDDTSVMLNVTGDTLVTGDALTTGASIASSGSFNNAFVRCSAGISNITDVKFDCVTPLIKTANDLASLYSPGVDGPQPQLKDPTVEAICWALGSSGTYLTSAYTYSTVSGNYYTYYEDGLSYNPAKFYMTTLPYKITSVTCAR